MVPVAPALFSTKKVWPVCSCSLAAILRVTTSTAPPGGYGTTILTGLAGQACAWGTVVHASVAAASAKLTKRVFKVCLLRMALIDSGQRCSTVQHAERVLRGSHAHLDVGVSGDAADVRAQHDARFAVERVRRRHRLDRE